MRRPVRRWTSPRRRTSSATCSTWSAAILRSCATLWATHRARRRLRACRRAALGSRGGVRLRLRGRARTPIASRRSAACIARHRIVVDPHTADGIKVGLERRDPRVPLVCIETALPAKFSATIKEALGREPARPAAYADLESRPQRCAVLPVGGRSREGVYRRQREGSS